MSSRILTKIKAITAMRTARPSIPPPTAPTMVPVFVADTGVLLTDADATAMPPDVVV